jgi:hypothetical protein
MFPNFDALDRSSTAIWLSLTLALGLTACGDVDGASKGTDESQVKRVIHRAGSAMSAGDGTTVCRLMTFDAQKRWVFVRTRLASTLGLKGKPPSSCEGAVSDIVTMPGFIEDTSPRILSVRIRADRAKVTADVSHDNVSNQIALLERHDGSWQIAHWFAQSQNLGK